MSDDSRAAICINCGYRIMYQHIDERERVWQEMATHDRACKENPLSASLEALARAWEASAENLTTPSLGIGTNEGDARVLRMCARQLRECLIPID